MIDCKITKNYFTERARMCEYYSAECEGCQFFVLNSCCRIAMEKGELERAIGCVQAWSNANPPRTYLSVLMEAFPKTDIGEAGTPDFCPSAIGFANGKEGCNGDTACVECWAQVMEE